MNRFLLILLGVAVAGAGIAVSPQEGAARLRQRQQAANVVAVNSGGANVTVVQQQRGLFGRLFGQRDNIRVEVNNAPQVVQHQFVPQQFVQRRVVRVNQHQNVQFLNTLNTFNYSTLPVQRNVHFAPSHATYVQPQVERIIIKQAPIVVERVIEVPQRVIEVPQKQVVPAPREVAPCPATPDVYYQTAPQRITGRHGCY